MNNGPPRRSASATPTAAGNAAAAGTFDAFVCCTPAEIAEARQIKNALEQSGLRCVISPVEIRPGHQPIMILLLTHETSVSETIEAEVARAVYRGFPLVVLRLDNSPPGKRLAYYLTSRPFSRVDAVAPPLEAHLPRLLRVVAAAVGLAAPAPPPGKAAAASGSRGDLPAAGKSAPRVAPQTRRDPAGRERVGFISYAAEDDELSDGAMLALRGRFLSELKIQLGCDVRLWQYEHTIPQGPQWESTLKQAISESEFFIPIMSPVALRSDACEVEYRLFLDHERATGRGDLVFPLLYVDIPASSEAAPHADSLGLSLVANRVRFDWRELRDDPVTSPSVARGAAEFCGEIAARLAQREVR
jgi:hypothetical protein